MVCVWARIQLISGLCCCVFPRFSRTAVARVSDDFYPRDPASSTPHIGACAYNSLFLGALVQPDWDMFQSAHPAGGVGGEKGGEKWREVRGRWGLKGGGGDLCAN